MDSVYLGPITIGFVLAILVHFFILNNYLPQPMAILTLFFAYILFIYLLYQFLSLYYDYSSSLREDLNYCSVYPGKVNLWTKSDKMFINLNLIVIFSLGYLFTIIVLLYAMFFSFINYLTIYSISIPLLLGTIILFKTLIDFNSNFYKNNEIALRSSRKFDREMKKVDKQHYNNLHQLNDNIGIILSKMNNNERKK